MIFESNFRWFKWTYCNHLKSSQQASSPVSMLPLSPLPSFPSLSFLHPLSLLVAMSAHTTPTLRRLSDWTQNTYKRDVNRVKLGIAVKLLYSSFRILVSWNRDVPTQESDIGEDGPGWDLDAPLLWRGALIELLSNRMKRTPSTYTSLVRVDTTSPGPVRKLRQMSMYLMQHTRRDGAHT